MADPRFCIYCGTPLLEDARFCAVCGKSVQPLATAAGSRLASVAPVWEYDDLIIDTRPRELMGILGSQVSRSEARLAWWSTLRPTVLQELQRWAADGWEPAAPIGPDCLVIREMQHTDFLVSGPAIMNKNTYIGAGEVCVQMRRQLPPGTPAPNFEVCELTYALNPNGKAYYRFHARLLGAQNDAVVATSPTFFISRLGGGQLDPDNKDALAALSSLIKTLEETGWQRRGSGSSWWGARFRRQSGVQTMEVCEVDVCYGKTGFASVPTRFEALAAGARIAYVAVASATFSLMDPPPLSSGKSKRAHETVVNTLTAEGWEFVEMGRNWWSARFRRPLPRSTD
jgi:hypothetical protein